MNDRLGMLASGVLACRDELLGDIVGLVVEAGKELQNQLDSLSSFHQAFVFPPDRKKKEARLNREDDVRAEKNRSRERMDLDLGKRSLELPHVSFPGVAGFYAGLKDYVERRDPI